MKNYLKENHITSLVLKCFFIDDIPYILKFYWNSLCARVCVCVSEFHKDKKPTTYLKENHAKHTHTHTHTHTSPSYVSTPLFVILHVWSRLAASRVWEISWEEVAGETVRQCVVAIQLAPHFLSYREEGTAWLE